MMVSTGFWADGRPFFVFDAIESGSVVRICWTPTVSQLAMARQMLAALSQVSR